MFSFTVNANICISIQLPENTTSTSNVESSENEDKQQFYYFTPREVIKLFRL